MGVNCVVRVLHCVTIVLQCCSWLCGQNPCPSPLSPASCVIPAAPEIPSLPESLPSLTLGGGLLPAWPGGRGWEGGLAASS